MTMRYSTIKPRRFTEGAPSAAALALFVWVLVAGGCDDDPVHPQPAGLDHVRFDTLAVGQRSHYLYFRCTHYGDPSHGTQTYVPDTLMLVVAGQEGDRFRIEESLTAGSASRHGAGHLSDPDTTYTYWMQSMGDSLFVLNPEGSSFLGSRIFLAGRQRFSLAPVAGPLTTFIGWQPNLPYHESRVTAYASNHAQFGRSFDRLNILQDNRDMQFDAPGYLFAYAGDHGLARWARYSWWTLEGTGWDLLPD